MRKLFIFICLLTLVGLISGVSRVQARGISGRVTDASGKGLSDVYVSAYDYNANFWVNGSDTDRNGNYSFNVAAGTYKVHFNPLPSSGYYAPVWYNSRDYLEVADLVRVTGFRTTIINAQLEMGGTISGRVTNASGAGIANVYVAAPDLYGRWTPGSFTDPNGDYSFNMPVGTYNVHFSPSVTSGYYAPEWYHGKGSLEIPDWVTVTAFQTTVNINAQLEAGGEISGRVTSRSGKGVANVYVYAVDPNYLSWIDGSSTDSNGNYNFNLPAGNYKVRFGSTSKGFSVPEWYDNKSDLQGADLVTVTAQMTSIINAKLDRIGGEISGRVIDDWGNGIAGVYVKAYDLDNSTIVINSTMTNSKGFFTIPLAEGKYKVGFFPGPEAENLAPEWYNDKSDFGSADAVAVKRFTKSVTNARLDPN